ncbi:MAG: PD-(D/E)XK nuclease family protein [Deltaproteobacteria bacterium]|jgi:hypothetical protein|nr:PD-(D/E)XK nuclease family protein [Deltaproteobacteria bacterium]
MSTPTLSPTGLKMFLQCPALFRARYVDKLFRPESNRWMERGTRVHSLIEGELIGKEPDWTEERAVFGNMKSVFEVVDRFRDEGYQMYAEYESAMSREDGKVDWWDESARYRSKLDLLLVHPERHHAVIVDWKTGKTPGDPFVQLAFNAMCVCPEVHENFFDAFFVYVDQGRAEHYKLSAIRGNAWVTDDKWKKQIVVNHPDEKYGVRYFLEKVDAACAEDDFPATPNDKCRWCDWKGCGLA